MGLLGFGRKKPNLLVAVTYEGEKQLRLNGNQIQSAKVKTNAAAHDRTVCWHEFAPGGGVLDRGLGPAATRLGPGVADRLLRDVPLTAECRAVVAELDQGRVQSGKWLPRKGAGESVKA